jgi:outer membrane lipoprotein carrier protein
VRMGFDGKGLRAMELVDHFGQTTVLRFSNLARNPKLDKSEFRFEPPKGADVLGEK